MMGPPSKILELSVGHMLESTVLPQDIPKAGIQLGVHEPKLGP